MSCSFVDAKNVDWSLRISRLTRQHFHYFVFFSPDRNDKNIFFLTKEIHLRQKELQLSAKVEAIFFIKFPKKVAAFEFKTTEVVRLFESVMFGFF